jgi:hypothetical protein
MAKMTITEALSEVNLIKKRIEKKIEFLNQNLIRADHVKDPFESEGGTAKKNESELQAVDDLHGRLVKIRSAIATANLANEITIGEKTMSIHDWLTWKREVAERTMVLTASLHKLMKAQLDRNMQQPSVYKDEKGETQLVKLVPNFDISALLKRDEALTVTFETLDGKLSLKNATILIDV